jgi:drug/metabolite transporter (DMT)-like permease
MNLRQWAGFLSLTLIWGASFLWIKIAVQETGPLTIVTLRLVFALVTLAGFLLAGRTRVPRSARLWGVLLLQGLMSTAIPWILITWAEKYIDSAVATVLNATVPLFTIICAHHFLHDDRMTVGRVVGLLTGFAGVAVLMQKGLFAGETPEGTRNMVVLGNLAMLLSSAFYAVSNVYGRAKLRGLSPVFQSFYTMLAADAVMWIVAPTVEAPFTLPTLGLTWLAIAWLGVLGAGLSYLIFYYLLHSIGPTRISVVTYTIPVVGVTLGVVFLGERLDWPLVVGMLLIVSGVWGVNQSGNRKETT